ncbi:potassium transporter Kup [Bradyrhizobium pachyrhizi]|uniref:potassium transporter Kup n=1 Tax=Bradyrhizobium pachyrhizi TaxID=280333 RepID=UPI003D3211F0
MALGVVYGDIGTSPLYAFKVALQVATKSGHDVGAAAVGTASLVIWCLIVIVSIKYAILILRADNRGEGGVVAMIALLGARDARRDKHGVLLVLGLIGAALLYGDGAITPAISVLSAVEGLETNAPLLEDAVIPITLAILVVLFFMQCKGTGFIGRIFGPIMLCWFVAIGVLGVVNIVHNPQVIRALLPSEAVAFVAHSPLTVSLGVFAAAFLAVTGGEAMYADMGHFGRAAIRAAWFFVAFPALVLNYMGQAALVASTPQAAAGPFYGLAPSWAHYPLVAFATAATVIASQAIISGIFSLTQQAIQLGFLPRLRVLHTACDERGQIYIPIVNWLLAIATLTAVLVFRSSDALAGAYGITVSGLMAISTFLAALVAIKWGHSLIMVVLVNGAFMLVDLLFFSANALKVIEGGWFPLLIVGVIIFLMLTWRRGLELLRAARAGRRFSEGQFIGALKDKAICRVPGTGAFLSVSRTGIPLSLSVHLKHNKALQERVLLVSVVTQEIPFVNPEERAAVSELSCGLERIVLKFGFMEIPNIPRGLSNSRIFASREELREISYYIGRETVIPDSNVEGMWGVREATFMWMQRNSATTGASFEIPSDQLIEMGTEIKI